MISSVIKNIVLKGISTNYFKHYKDRKTFETNLSDLPNNPSFTECQKDFTFPGHIIQNTKPSFQGAIYFNYAVNPTELNDLFNNQSIDKINSNSNESNNKTDNQSNIEKYDFTDDYNQSFIILNSELSHNKAFFNRISNQPKNDINTDKFEYIFAAIYPFDINTFRKMQGYKIIIHNI